MLLADSALWRDTQVELFLLEEEHVGIEYVRWLNDPRVNRYLESRFVVHDLEGVRTFVRQSRADPATLFLGIRALDLGSRHVGNIKLGPIDRHHALGEVGILIGEPDAWGRGLASEAISVLCRIAHAELGLRKLTAGCYGRNLGSERAFRRAGFQVEARRVDHLVHDGGLDDQVLMGRWLSR